MNPFQIIEECAKTNSSKEKVRILKENDSDLLRYVLENAVSPFIVFGVKQHTFAEPLLHEDFEINLNQFKFCLHHLKLRDIGGQKYAEFIRECSKHLNEEQQNVLSKILNKDLDAGIGEKIVNEAFPGLIPEFDVQLCNDLDFDKIKYPCYAEIKRDGRRNLSFVINGEVRHYSRNGKENENFHVFDKELIALTEGTDAIFDGEVSTVAEGDNRNERRETNKQARRKKDVDTSKLIYTVWDTMPILAFKTKKCGIKLFERYDRLVNMFKQYRENTQNEEFKVRLSKVVMCHNREEIEAFYKKVLMQGKEGLVIKDPNSAYEFKRSNSWMKYKPEYNIDAPIVEVIEGKKSREGTLGSLVVDVEGVHVHCGMGKGITIEECERLWGIREQLIGMTAEITHAGKTLDGSLSVGKFVKIRDDK